MVCMRIESVKSLTRHASTCHSGVSNPIIRNSRWMSGGKPLHNACRLSVRCTFLIEICLAPKHSHATQCGFYLDNVTSNRQNRKFFSAREIFTFLPVLNENEERPIMSRGVIVYTILDSSRGGHQQCFDGVSLQMSNLFPDYCVSVLRIDKANHL